MTNESTWQKYHHQASVLLPVRGLCAILWNPLPSRCKLMVMDPREIARRIILHEAGALSALADSLDQSFDEVIRALDECHGRVVLTGVGKSGIVARKIAATFLSTGTPALFLHPTEGAHGDLGAILASDLVILISNSGESTELIGLVPAIRAIGARMIAMTGNPQSSLARAADWVLTCHVEREADQHNLVPSASTSAQLALGDALALVLLEQRGESPDDMARRHPAGAIGRRLTLKVSDLMSPGPDDPRVLIDSTFREALFELTDKRLGRSVWWQATESSKGSLPTAT